MTRVGAVPEYDQLRLGLSVVLAFMLLMSAWLGRVLMVWARYVGGARPHKVALLGLAVPLAPTNERKLVRAVEAQRQASQRPAEARQQSSVLAARASRVELLAIGIFGAIIALALSVRRHSCVARKRAR